MRVRKTAEGPDLRPYLRQFYRGNWGYLGLGLLQAPVSTACSLVFTWLVQQCIDLIDGTEMRLGLWGLFCIAVVAIALDLLSSALAYVSKPRFMARASAQYREYVFAQLSQKGIGAFSGESSALYLSALSNDMAAIENGYLANLFVIVRQMLGGCAAVAMMLYYSPLLTGVSILLAALPISAALLTGNAMTTAEKQLSEKNEQYISVLRDCLTGFSVMKAFRAERQIGELYGAQVGAVAAAQEWRRKVTVLVNGCADITADLLQVGVFLVGAWLALSRGVVTAGIILAFVQLLNCVISPIRAIPTALAERKAARALIAKLATALESNVRDEGGAVKTTLSEGIHIDHLSYGYEPDAPVLHDLSFDFEAGKSYAIVGASGSGKSTLLNLLMASSADYAGEIVYDDTELRQIGSASLYELVSLVQQNVFVFNASIRDNLTMFSDFPAADVERAIERSGLSALIAARGEDYLCGESGSALSGGEKQRISIARSLLKQAQVLLVDEATAALDAQTAYQVSSAILDIDGLTRIVVTHALDAALLQCYDCILTMKAGRIVESGDFETLMGEKGYFYSLFTVSQ